MTDLIEQERNDMIEETKRLEKDWFQKMQKNELKMVLVKNKLLSLANQTNAFISSTFSLE